MQRTLRRVALGIGFGAALVAGLAPSARAAITANAPANYTPQTNGRVEDIAYDKANDTAYIVGNFTQVRNAAGGAVTTRNYAAAFRISTGALLPWNPNLNGVARAVQFHSGFPHVYVGGSFTTVGGVTRNRIADLDPTTGAAQAFNPTVWADVKTLALHPNNQTIYVGGVFHSLRGQGQSASVSRNLAGAFNTATGAVTAWDPQIFQQTPYGTGGPGLNGPPCPPNCFPTVFSLLLTPDASKVYIGGTFAWVGGDGSSDPTKGTYRRSAAQVDSTTGKTITAWNPNVFLNATTKGSQNSVYEVVQLGSQVFLCGDFFKVGGQTRTNVASVNNTTGALTPGFITSTDGAVNGCDVSGTTFYIGGHFQWVGGPGQGQPHCVDNGNVQPCGVFRNHIAALNPTTGTPTAWNPFVNSVHGIYAMRVTTGVLGIGGEFTTVASINHQGYAQWNGTP